MREKIPAITLPRQLIAYAVHLLTGLAGVVGLFTLEAIFQGKLRQAFGLMGLSVFIDSIDGTLARRFHVKTMTPNIDGALLDNIVDYLNYVLTPSCLLLIDPSFLPDNFRKLLVSLIILAAAYQFTQTDAKTSDHFFKGFPSYWNFVVFYLFLFHWSPWVNAAIILTLMMLVFIPIKYLYLSQLQHFSHQPKWRCLLLILSGLFGLINILVLISYPTIPSTYISYIMAYIILYTLLSLYRTLFPLPSN